MIHHPKHIHHKIASFAFWASLYSVIVLAETRWAFAAIIATTTLALTAVEPRHDLWATITLKDRRG